MHIKNVIGHNFCFFSLLQSGMVRNSTNEIGQDKRKKHFDQNPSGSVWRASPESQINLNQLFPIDFRDVIELLLEFTVGVFRSQGRGKILRRWWVVDLNFQSPLIAALVVFKQRRILPHQVNFLVLLSFFHESFYKIRHWIVVIHNCGEEKKLFRWKDSSSGLSNKCLKKSLPIM